MSTGPFRQTLGNCQKHLDLLRRQISLRWKSTPKHLRQILVATVGILCVLLLGFALRSTLLSHPAPSAEIISSSHTASTAASRRIVLRLHTPAALAHLHSAVRQATEFLIRSCDELGFFVYEWQRVHSHRKHRDVETQWRKDTHYNILRHAGTMYAIGQVCWPPAGDVESTHCVGAGDAMVRASHWLVNETIAPVPGVGLSAIFSQRRFEMRTSEWSPTSSSPKETDMIKLGALGLGMVALASTERMRPGSVPVETVKNLGRFAIEHMMHKSGMFYHLYYPGQQEEKVEEHDTLKALYYPGEAVLGLVMVYNMTADRYFLEGAAKALVAISESRKDAVPGALPSDHWAMLATREILPYLERDDPGRTAILRHAVQIVRSMYEIDLRRTSKSDMGSASLGTSLEGTFAALPLVAPRLRRAKLQGTEELPELEQVFCLAANTAGILLAGQTRDGPDFIRGGMPASFKVESSEATMARHGREFLSDKGKYRIDHTQHTVSAWMGYLRAKRELAGIDCAKVTIPVRPAALFVPVS